MKKNKLLKVILAIALVISLVLPETISAEWNYGHDLYKINFRDTNFGEARQNADFKAMQSNFRYGALGASGEYQGLVPEPVDLVFGEDERDAMFRPLGFPRSYDLRDYNKLSPIRDQGPNGSCWTFACYSSLESVLRPAEDPDFSEKHMRDSHGFDWGPDKGGNRFMSSAYLARWSGPVAEADCPYDPYNYYVPKGLTRVKDLTDVYYLPDMDSDFEGGMNAIKNAIMQYGAVQTAMYSSNAYINQKTWAHYYPRRGNGNHAVAIVGWNDDYPKENFLQTPPANGAWLIRNSWGEEYGISGYFWASYYDTIVGTNNAVYFAKDMQDDENIYQYDPYGMTRTVGYNGKGYAANVFGRLKKDEYVNGAGFFVASGNTDYEVFVVPKYTGLESLANNRISVAKGRVDYPGYHTVEFNQVPVNSGDNFAVVVYFYSSETNYPIAIEAREYQYASKVNSYPGQSFTSEDGIKWTDLTTYNSSANVCVKAFTVNSSDGTIPEDVKVSGVNFKNDKIYLKENETHQLTFEVLPQNAKDKSVTFTSDNENVATVDNMGNVKAVAEGYAYITIRTNDGGFTDRVLVNVTKPAPVQVKVTKVDITNSSIYIGEGDKAVLNVKITPENATNKTINFESRYPDVATVDQNGVITAIKPGYTWIYATSVDGPYDYVYVNVKKSSTPSIVKVTDIVVPQQNIEMNEGDVKDINATVVPTNATDKTLTYTSSKTYVATVDSYGRITSKSAGDTVITISSKDGVSKNVYVTVKRVEKSVEVTNVFVDSSYIYLNAGETKKIGARVYPYNATDQSLNYTSSNPDAVTVDENGYITGIAKGYSYITVRANNGKYATIYVSVRGDAPQNVKVNRVYLDKSSLSLYLGEQYTVATSFYPTNATNKNVTWTSLNPRIATVDENGTITAVSGGSVYIYAKSADGPQAYIKVTVNSFYNYYY